MKQNNKKGDLLVCFQVYKVKAYLLGNILRNKQSKGKGINRVGDIITRASYGSKRSVNKTFNSISSFN